MTTEPCKVGALIQALRKEKGITQSDLGRRLGVSFQAVSKWGRGETLPDTAILSDLAEVLETSVDHLLKGEEHMEKVQRTITMAEMREGIECFEKIGELLGKDSWFYMGAIGGVNLKMNTEFEKAFEDPYLKECFISEAAIQCIQNGAKVDLEDVKKGFRHEKWANMVLEYAKKYGAI